MRIVSERQLAIVLGGLAGTPRVVGGGNFGTPWQAMPVREGVTLESPFAGPGRRGQSRLRYFPCRLSLVPACRPVSRRAGDRAAQPTGPGSSDLYTWMDRNPDMRMLRTETVNDPARIARQPRMTSVNSVLQVDLFAQAKADASTVVPRIDGPVTSFQPP